MTSFFAQDTCTRARLTLQGGVRYDSIGTGYPDVAAGGPGYQLMPTRIAFAAGTTDEIHWKDITPRMGACARRRIERPRSARQTPYSA